MPAPAAPPSSAATRGGAPLREPLGRADLYLGLLLGLLAGLLYGRTAPAVVNADGLGYLKLLPHNFAAGHLLFMPILRFTAAIFRGHDLLAGRILDAVAGGLAVATLYGCARAWLRRGAAFLAAAGCALSYALWVQGSDVEAYACSLLALLLLLALCLAYRPAPSLVRAAAVGLALAGAVTMHITHLMIVPFVVACFLLEAPVPRRRARAHTAVALLIGGAVTVGAYAWAALHVRRLDLLGAIHWIRTASHGFAYGGSPGRRLADAVSGAAKALVWSPYLYESDAQTMLAQFILGLLPLVTIVGLIVLRRRHLAPLPVAALLLWIGPYAAMALAFFASDHERWLFALPPLWILLARAVDSLPHRRELVATALVAYLGFTNATTAIGPARHDSWTRTRADVAAALMGAGDLVIFPGHSWDEYVGFYSKTRIRPLPLVYYAGLGGAAGLVERLEMEIREAQRRRARIFAVRLFDEEDDDTRGFLELGALGLPRPALHRLIDERFTRVALPTVEPKVTVWRLEPRSPPPR